MVYLQSRLSAVWTYPFVAATRLHSLALIPVHSRKGKGMLAEQVLTRYRELDSNLEASIQVREEAEQKGQHHWHRLYERCWCGRLTVPAKYYDAKGNTQEDAEKAFLASLSPQDVPTGDKPTEMSPPVQVCGECRVRPPEAGRSACAACRKRAYRRK